MPQIRRYGKVGDIIVGMAGAGGLKRIHPQLIYWMRVNEAIGFDEYWADPRFEAKRPDMNGPKLRKVGDRTYRRDPASGEWRFEQSMHYLPSAKQKNGGHVTRNTKVDRLLLSHEFTYWGDRGPALPVHLMELFPNPRGQKCPKDGPLLVELHNFIELDKPCGVVGEPADWSNARYFTSK